MTGSAWNINTTGRGSVMSGGLEENRAKELDSFSLVNHMQHDYQQNRTKYQNLTKLECLSAYSNTIEPEPNLLLVSSDERSSERFNSSLLSWGFHKPTPGNITRYPICSLSFSKRQCQLLSSLTAEQIGTFQVENHSINYCLNRPTDAVGMAAQACHLQCSPVIILSRSQNHYLDIRRSICLWTLVVAIFNALKCICIFLVIMCKREPTLSILGDAIASFLNQPDQYTKHLGITSKREIVRSDKSWSGSKGLPLPWGSRPSRWHSAATNRRWIFTMVS